MTVRLAILSVLAVAAAGPAACALDLIGYVPDYRMTSSSYVDNELPGQLALLDEVRYFGITVNSSGGLTTTAAQRAQLQTLVDKINGLPLGQRPRLNITLGGAGLSDSFSAIAANGTLRGQLAQNIQTLLNETGATGVDLDWEHPADGSELTTLFPQLLADIKQVVGASRRVSATVDPSKILPKSVFQGANAIDGVSLMTYDLDWWANDPVDFNLGQHSLPEYVAESVNAWTNTAGASIPRTWVFGAKNSVDAPESRLGIGAPFYGKGFNGTSPGVAVAYRDLAASGTTTDHNAYAYQGSKVWLPGKEMLVDRIEYANAAGLQQIIFWEMYHDFPVTHADSLLRAAYDANLMFATSPGDFNRDGNVDSADLAVWRTNFSATSGATTGMGDANGDGAVNGSDFLHWQQNVHAAAALAANFQVPEPSWQRVCFGAAAAAVFFAGRRGRNSRLTASHGPPFHKGYS